MDIVIAKTAGFCFGVKNAIDKTMQAQGKVVTLGEIIHNDIVVNQLKEKGIFPINSLDEYTDGKVIIRSHGVGKKVYERLKTMGIEYIDATCPFVEKIHKIVHNAYVDGKQVIITGEPTHAEVVGINGWCEDSAIILSSVLDAEKLDFIDKECILVSQTTFSAENYTNIKKIIKNKCKIVEIFETICYTTRDRQQEVISLAKECDTMLVIGGKHSSNTIKLFELSKQYCNNSYLITCVDDLSKVVNLRRRLGITAGASTPKELIMEVVNIMSETQVKSNEMLNEEVAVNANDEVNNEFVSAMEEISNSAEVKPREGKKTRVTVVNASDDGIIVNFGGKNDAFIDRTEVEINVEDYNPANYVEGQQFDAEFIAKKSKNDTMIAMSKRVIAQREEDRKKFDEIVSGNEFTITIDKAVKGGLISKLGPYTIFVPQSQIRIGFEKNPERFVGKEMRVRKIDAKNDEKSSKNKIVASHSIIAEEEKLAKEEAFWGQMIPNTIVKGKVKRFTQFGAFVSVNGNDCLAHISDLSWVKVAEPSEVLEINKTYEFLILNADRETGKVSLGYKQLQKKPYEEAQDKYPVDSVVKGTVERIFAYGAFVSIDRGVDGLIPVSEISYNYVKDANEAFKVGQEVEAKVIKFDGNKITLSVKALLDPPAVEANQEVEITSEDVKENNEKRAKANAKKFENAVPQARKPRAKKVVAPVEEEAKSWTSESAGATLGDLFKGLNLNFDNKDAE